MGTSELEFVLPSPRMEPKARAGSRVFTHKGEWMQGPISVTTDTVERYTMGVFTLLDKLNSAYVEVRKSDYRSSEYPIKPKIILQSNGWNKGEVELVKTAVEQTWVKYGNGEPYLYNVYGYHDIRVGAGSGSSSALVLAAVRATALEHDVKITDEILREIHSQIENGADALHSSSPEVVGTRVRLKGPIRSFGARTPRFMAVTWSAGDPVTTTEVRFVYKYDDVLLWRVRWASMQRAVRSDDVKRVACLATESARENQSRNPKVDMDLLEAAIIQFGALGFSVAHTGTYHTALFHKDTADEHLGNYRDYVISNTKGNAEDVKIFDTAEAAEERWRDDL